MKTRMSGIATIVEVVPVARLEQVPERVVVQGGGRVLRDARRLHVAHGRLAQLALLDAEREEAGEGAVAVLCRRRLPPGEQILYEPFDVLACDRVHRRRHPPLGREPRERPARLAIRLDRPRRLVLGPQRTDERPG
jgi:hypothetical protein